jgi:hypothetical protein
MRHPSLEDRDMELPKARGVLKRMVRARLQRLRDIGPCLAGSLVKQPGHNSRYLTDKVRGKTRTLYIPLDLLDEARQWNENHKEARRLLRELEAVQRALLEAEIAARRRQAPKS